METDSPHPYYLVAQVDHAKQSISTYSALFTETGDRRKEDHFYYPGWLQIQDGEPFQIFFSTTKKDRVELTCLVNLELDMSFPDVSHNTRFSTRWFVATQTEDAVIRILSCSRASKNPSAIYFSVGLIRNGKQWRLQSITVCNVFAFIREEEQSILKQGPQSTVVRNDKRKLEDLDLHLRYLNHYITKTEASLKELHQEKKTKLAERQVVFKELGHCGIPVEDL